MPDDVSAETKFVKFWNEVLVPKFIAFKHVPVDGLTHHSEAAFPTSRGKESDSVLDVGCGFGDTAMKLARQVDPKGCVLGVDCCDAPTLVGKTVQDAIDAQKKEVDGIVVDSSSWVIPATNPA